MLTDIPCKDGHEAQQVDLFPLIIDVKELSREAPDCNIPKPCN